MATPTYAQVISQINTFIVTNHNNEITADVLNPILVLLTDFTNNTIGDLNTLTTDEKDTIVAAINSLKNNLTNIVNNGVQLYTGMGDPNVTPPPTYKPADFYLQIDFDSLPVQLWQFDGFTWVADGGGSSNWGLIFGDIHDQADLMAELNLRELLANKQNSMAYDGTGVKYPTVDAVNIQANNIYRAVVATGFLDTTDSFLLSRVDDFTLGIAASQFGIAFSQFFKTPPYHPSDGIFQLTARNIPLSAIGLVGTGTAIKFVGYRASDDSILFSDTQFIQSPSVCQLGIVLVKYSGGVTSFIDATRTTITIPDVAAYSNLDTVTTGVRASTSIAAIAGTLSHSNTLGSLVGISVAWHTSNNDSKVIPALNPTTFTRLSPANALTVVPPTVFNTLDPTQYWNGTALIAIAGGAGVSSVQRLLFTVNGNFVWQYGEATYPNLVAAQNNILQAIFTNILPVGTFAEVGRMAITKGCTDLNSANAQYYPTGSTGGGGTSPISPTAWGFITGSIDDQLDLKAKLDLRELLANKATTLVGNETSDIKYPTTKLLFDNLALKQNVITNPITGTGTGTVNTLAKFTAASVLGNSTIIDTGALVTINSNTRFNGTNILQGTTSSDGPIYGAELLTTGSGTNWAGTDYATGYTHTAGSTTPLTSVFSTVINNNYRIVVTITGRTAGTVTVSIGGGASAIAISSSTTQYLRAIATGALLVTPTTDFDGTVAISLNLITASVPLVDYKTSSGTSNSHIRITGVNNLYFGLNSGQFSSLTSASNTIFGNNNSPLLLNNVNIVSFGSSILSANNTNNYVIAFGSNIFTSLKGGYNQNIYNIGIGDFVATALTTGAVNTFIGYNIATSATTANSNLGIGFNTFFSLTSGSSNVGLAGGGANAGALLNNTTGSNNISIANLSGKFIADGVTPNTITNNSIYIGQDTRALADNQTNQIVIGHTAIGQGSNSIQLGNSAIVKFGHYGQRFVLSVPPTSAGTYDIVTRNQTTGAEEKIPSTSIPLDSTIVHLTGAETITGLKTFSNTLTPTVVVINSLNTGQAIVGLTNDIAALLSIGINGSTYVGSASYGAAGDVFIRASATANDLNIITSTAKNIKFITNNVERARIDSNGNFAIGTDTFIGDEKLRVNGKIEAVAGTTANQVVVKSQLDAALPYKVYALRVSQASTSIPTSASLQNNTTIPNAPVWERTAVGDYRFFVGTMDATKVFPYALQATSGFGDYTISADIQGQYIRVTTRSAGTLTDGLLNNALIEIRVYP